MKKLTLLVGLLFLVASVTFAMSIKEDVDETSDDTSATVKKETAVKPGYYEKQFKKAIKYYFDGDFAKAEDICDKIVIAEPENEAAMELQSKIAFLKKKEETYKKELVDSYYVELRKAVMEGNCYEGFLYLKKIGAISKNEKMDYFSNVLVMEKENIVSRFSSKSDKNTFLKSLDAFVKENFSKSTNLLFKLQEKYPQFSIYLSISRAKEFKDGSEFRKKQLYKEAIKSLHKNEFVSAQVSAELLYMMDYSDITAKLLLDQIELEIED
ncbi:MAG: hypothetical protein II816_06085 [Elusimicrobia bacterium]|nr:hypothetical protein [Elusimicrobiota bacterium]